MQLMSNTRNEPYTKSSSLARKFNLYRVTQPQDPKTGSEIMTSLSGHFIAVCNTGVLDKPDERLSMNVHPVSSGIAGPLPKLRDGECAYVKRFITPVEATA